MACTLLLLGAADARAAWPTAVNSQITLAPSSDSPSTTVNPQITDAITQTNVKVLGEAPAMAMGQLFTTTADAVSVANATNPAMDANVGQATTTQSVQTLYAVDTASDPAAVSAILQAACGTYLTARLFTECAAGAAA